MTQPRSNLSSRPARRRALRRLEIIALLVLIPLAAYLWTAPSLAERALAKASLQELVADSQRHPENPRIFHYLGLRYQRAGNHEQALTAFSRAAQMDTGDEASWLGWAAASEALDNEDDSYQILIAFLKSHPESAPAHYALALIYRHNQAHKRAWQEASAAVRCNPRDADAWRLAGEEALNWGRPAEAEATMRRAVALRPHDWRNQMVLGNVLMAQKQGIPAVSCYREAVRLGPREALAHLCLGRAQLIQAQASDEIEIARRSLRQATRLQPGLAPAYLLLGQSYIRQARWIEARYALLQAERIAPNNADVAFALTNVYQHTAEPAQAARFSRRHQLLKDFDLKKYTLITRIQLRPSDIKTRLEVARLCAAHGEFADARYFYRSALVRSPDSEAVRQELAAVEDAYARKSRPPIVVPGVSKQALVSEAALLTNADSLLAHSDLEGAKKAYLAILAMDRNSARTYQGLGFILNAQGKAEDAFRFFAHAVKLDPGLSAAQYVLAQRYREIGFAQEAVRRMLQVVHVAPDNAEYWHELGRDYSDGDSEKAEQAYQHAVTLAPNSVAYLLDLADRQAANGRSREAEVTYRRALGLAPDSSDALSRLGGFLLSASPATTHQQEAEYLLRRAVSIEPNNEYASYSLGRLAMTRNDTKQAVVYFRRVVAENADIADAWYALSRAYTRLGDHERAAKAAANSRRLHEDYLDRIHLPELIHAHPKDSSLHLKLARLSARNGETAKAIVEYRICIQQNARDATAHKELDALIAFLKSKGRMPPVSLFTLMVADMAQKR